MDSKRCPVVWVLCLAAASLGGCAASGPTAANFAVQHFESGERAVFLTAAVAALEEFGYQASPRDADSGRLVSEPRYDLANDQPTARAVHISSKSRTRRIVEIRVEHQQAGLPADDRISVYCRVLVQEQTTRAHRLLAIERSGSDSPSTTPIERGAATTDRQNTVWETIRRDRLTERRILAAVANRFNASKRTRFRVSPAVPRQPAPSP